MASEAWQWVKCAFHIGTESLSLAWSCWPALLEVFWWLPVNSKGLGAYWSVPDSLSDCFVREVLENWLWKWSTSLCLKKQLLWLNRAGGAVRTHVFLVLHLHLLLEEGLMSFPNTSRLLEAIQMAQGT